MAPSYYPRWHTFWTPRGVPVEMLCRDGTNDWNTTNACLTEDEYGGRDLNLSGLAVDVGGYTAGWAIGAAIDNPDLRVIVVEPVPSNIELIRQNIAANNLDDRILLIEGAAAGPDILQTTIRHSYRGNDALEHHAFVGNTSLVYELPGVEEHDETVVGCVSIGLLVEQFGPISFIKIDCEGCEYSFLSDPAVATIPFIRGEWHPIPWTGRGMLRKDVTKLLPKHTVVFTGPAGGPGGFTATLKVAA